jgi:PhoD-like phosphatase
VKLVFGSCRISAPHEPPYSLSHEQDERGLGVDALYAMAMRLRKESAEELPHALVLLGDQVYADEVSEGTLEFIRSRRDTSKPPGEEVADFEEYTRLYWDAWKDPTIRWLLSTVPSAMIFDDHEVSDDWNISESWLEEARAKPRGRSRGGTPRSSAPTPRTGSTSTWVTYLPRNTARASSLSKSGTPTTPGPSGASSPTGFTGRPGGPAGASTATSATCA